MAVMSGNEFSTDEEDSPKANNQRSRQEKAKLSMKTLLLQLQLMEERSEAVLKQNARLLEELAEANRLCETEGSRQSDLDMRLKAARHDDLRSKATAQNLQKTAVHRERSDAQGGADAAQQVCELNEVHRKMVHVRSQLEYAVNSQKSALDECKAKVAARTRRCRRLEDALYRIVAEAQQTEGLLPSVEDGVKKCGPLVHAVLKRGAERLALRQLDGEETFVEPSMTIAER